MIFKFLNLSYFVLLNFLFNISDVFAQEKNTHIQNTKNSIFFELDKCRKLILEKKFKQSRAVLETLLTNEPNNFEIKMTYAELLRRIAEVDKALEQYKEVAKLFPKNIYPHIALSDIYLVNMDMENSLSEIQEARNLDPDNPDTKLAYAKVLLKLGRLNEVENILKNLDRDLASDFNFEIISYELSKKLGQLTKAKTHLERAIETRNMGLAKFLDQNTKLELELVYLNKSMKKFDEERDVLQKILFKDPYNFEARLLLAEIYEFVAYNFIQAKKEYEQINKFCPFSKQAENGIRRCLTKQRDIAFSLKKYFYTFYTSNRTSKIKQKQ